MSRLPIIGAAVAVVLAAYTVSPLFGAYRIAEAATSGDPARVARHVDKTRLRRSFAAQITRAYFAMSERTRDLPPFARSLAMAVGGGAAEALLEDILTPEAIAAFLDGRSPGLGPARDLHGLRLTSVQKALSSDTTKVLRESYYMNPVVFVVMLPNGLGIDLRWSGTAWRLAGVELPRELSDALAREVLRHERSAA